MGYPEEHSSDTFRIMKVKTKTICFSRDVKWLGKTYGEYFGTKISKNTEDTQFESSDDEEIELTRIKKSKVKKLEGNKDLEKNEDDFESEIEFEDEYESYSDHPSEESSVLEAGYMNKESNEDPLTFDQAWNHPEKSQRFEWRKAIKTEISNMEKNKVWDLINNSELPKGRKVIGNKWVFKLKRNGTYQARLVALTYNQIPGVDFLEISH